MSKLDKNTLKRLRLESIFIFWQEEFERIAGRLVESKSGRTRMLALESEQWQDILTRSIHLRTRNRRTSFCFHEYGVTGTGHWAHLHGRRWDTLVEHLRTAGGIAA
jgi:hypothetical protein